MAVPSTFTPPVWPDFHACNDFYHSLNKPDVLDCHEALRTMLSGSDDQIWHIGRGIYGIPQIRVYGSCEIQLQASGPATYYGQEFIFSPDKIRNMAGWVIDQCVFGDQTGGYATAGIANTINYVALPDTFYEDPFPVDTTFINVVVWNSDRLFPEFNPGNMDPNTGAVITGEIVKAFVAEPDYSPLKMNIERNLEYFGRAILAMDRINFRTWWQGPPRESMTNSSVTNLTDSMNDLSLSANVTSAINLTASMADLTLPANVTLPVNFTILGLNSTSICAGAGQRITPGCTGQDNDLLSTS